MTLYQTAAYVFTALSCVVFLFHVCLVFGAPWGAATLGGRFKGKLPKVGRVFSGISALAVAAFAAVILHHVGLIRVDVLHDQVWTAWMVAGYCVLGFIMHVATPSAVERWIWLPVVTIMMISSGIVAWMK